MANFTLPIGNYGGLDLPFDKSLVYGCLGALSIAATIGFKALKSPAKGSVNPATKNDTAAGSDDPRSIVAHIASNELDGLIFYGSQTGTAEDYARRLGKALHNAFDLQVGVADLEDFDMTTLSEVSKTRSAAGNEVFLGFVLATYGDGEPTDNAVEFNELLTDDSAQFADDSRSENTLEGLKYLAFGLGNDTYEKYNFMIRHVTTQLDSLGATRIGKAGEGNDGAGTMDEDFLQWKDATLETMATAMGFQKSEKAWSPSYTITAEPGLDRLNSEVDLGDRVTSHAGDHKRHLGLAPVLYAQELYNPDSIPRRECIHMELNIQGTGLKYTTGDHVGVWPTNAEPEVERLISVLGINNVRDTVIRALPVDANTPPLEVSLTTYATVLRYHLEICGSVSRAHMSILQQFAPSQEARDLLSRLKDDKDYFHEFVTARCLNLGQLLQLASQGAPWNGLPFATLFDLLPALQPRYYSISSSSTLYPNAVHITTAVKRDSLGPAENREFYGVASNYILALAHEYDPDAITGSKKLTFELKTPRTQADQLSCAVHIRASTFRLPPNSQTPIIMVGPGTGVAPFRGFVQERVETARQGLPIGQSVLYFGCRKEKDDFLYADEWRSAKSELGDSFTLRTAFSREGAQKVYVQQKLLEDTNEVFELLEKKKAWFYICGDAKHMAKDVHDTLASIIEKRTGGDGRKYIQDLKTAGRLHEDIW